MMKKWLLLLWVAMMLTSVFAAATVKVAVLPLKRLDSASKYIQNIMTIRDLDRTFKKTDKYELIDLKYTKEVFKESDIEDIDEMDKEDMAALGKELKADLVILGVISSVSDQVFSIQFRFYSMRTDDLKSQRVDVVKDKRKRWAVLDKDFLDNLSKFFSDELDKMNTLAIQDYNAENYKQAEQGFNNILSYQPDNKEAYYYLGLIAYHNKNYNKSISDLNKALPTEVTTADTKILQSLSNVYRDMGNKEMMLNTLVKLAQIQNDEDMWLSIGNLYAENNQNQKAKEALENALKINPDFVKAQYRLALLLYDMGNYNDAIPYLEKAANDNPENDLIARRLAYSYQKAGQIDLAIRRYENAIKTNPNDTGAYLNIAGLYRIAASEAADKSNKALETKNNNKTLDVLTRLKAIDAENPLVYLRFADVYLSMNNLNDSESNANTAIQKDASLYQPYIILASINQRRGTDKYNQFIDLEKRAREAYGATANRLVKERDAARIAANGLFRKADEQLKAAKSRTSDPEVVSDLDNKITTMAQLISQSGKAF